MRLRTAHNGAEKARIRSESAGNSIGVRMNALESVRRLERFDALGASFRGQRWQMLKIVDFASAAQTRNLTKPDFERPVRAPARACARDIA